MDAWMDTCVYGPWGGGGDVHTWMSAWMDACVGAWMGAWMDACMDGRM